MINYYALVKDGFVRGVIVTDENTDQAYFDYIQSENDFVINVTELDPRPNYGWSYDGETFSRS